MNIGRCTLLILVGWLLSNAGSVLAQTPLPNSVFEDWSAVVNEVTLPDGSVLFDYTARSFSGRTEGAMLAISFVPRFHCAPTLSLRTPSSARRASDVVALEVTIDSERMQFDGIFDGADGYMSYAISASSEMQNQLRKKIDVASRISFKIQTADARAQESSTVSSGVNGLDSIVFSLLGSRMAALSAEEHCRAHKPLAFSPR